VSRRDKDHVFPLVRAAVRFAAVLETPEGPHTLSDEYTSSFMHADEELREAALAIYRSLSPRERERIAGAVVKERPILFKASMIRALLAGTKTQTRRIAKWKPCEAGLNLNFSGLEAGCYANDNPATGWVLRSRDGGGCWNDRTWPLHCPYGTVGDRLWVRETFQPLWSGDRCPASLADPAGWALGYPASDGVQEYHDPDDGLVTRCKPGIHMPRWASRITLEMTNVRVERLQAITEDDALAEGVDVGTSQPATVNGRPGSVVFFNARDAFAYLWNAINGDRAAWASNPWVFVIEFRRVV